MNEIDFEKFKITTLEQADIFIKWVLSKDGAALFNKDGQPMNHKWIKGKNRLRFANMLFKEVKKIAKQNEHSSRSGKQ